MRYKELEKRLLELEERVVHLELRPTQYVYIYSNGHERIDNYSTPTFPGGPLVPFSNISLKY